MKLMSGEMVDATVKGAVKSLLSRYGVESIPSLLSEAVRIQFERAIQAGLEALAAELATHDQGAVLFRASHERFEQFIKSPEVATELSKLLDPGFEVIDTVALTHSLAQLIDVPGPDERMRLASEGWQARFAQFPMLPGRSKPWTEMCQAYSARNMTCKRQCATMPESWLNTGSGLVRRVRRVSPRAA